MSFDDYMGERCMCGFLDCAACHPELQASGSDEDDEYETWRQDEVDGEQ